MGRRDRERDITIHSSGNRAGGSAVGKMLSSGVIGALCLGIWGFAHGPFILMPIGIFFGVLPAVRAMRRLFDQMASAPRVRRVTEKERAAELERAVLRVARANGGTVTPALVVLNSELQMEDAQKLLDAMAARGHATLRVRDDGRLEYEFREFLPG